MFRKAKSDLESALKHNSKSYLAALHLLNIAQFEGDNQGAARALDLANSIYPPNFLARARYAVHLMPRWGGSYDRVDAFIAHCRSQRVPESTIALIQAVKLEDQGHAAAERGHTKEAIAFFERALPLSRAGGSRFRGVYLRYSLYFCAKYKFGGEYCS